MSTAKETRSAILNTALDLHYTVEEMTPVHWQALELSVPGPLAAQIRRLSDAVFADQQRRAKVGR